MSNCNIEFRNNKLYLQHSTESFSIGSYVDFECIDTEDIKSIIEKLVEITKKREEL